MKLVYDLQLIHLIGILNYFQKTNAYYDMFYQQTDQKSQSQENISDMEHTQEHQHYNERSNQNHDYGHENDECNNCACNNCDNPSECCRKVCENCPKSTISLSQFQLLRMPQMASMPISRSLSIPAPSTMTLPLHSPSMHMFMHQMSQMSQIPQWSQLSQISQIPQMIVQQMQMPPMPMTMPQMQISPMQMPIPSGTFANPSPYANQGLVLFPFPPNFINVSNNMTTIEQPKATESVALTTIQTTTTEAATTTTEAVTTTTEVATTTTEVVTTTTDAETTTLATPSIDNTTTKTKVPVNENSHLSNITFKTKNYEKIMFESVLKNLLTEYSNGIIKSPKRLNIYNDKLMMLSRRRTKPSLMTKFGIVPIPNNMAARIMSQLRNVNSIDRRTKRTTILVP